MSRHYCDLARPCDMCGQADTQTDRTTPSSYLAPTQRWLAVPVGWILVVQAALATASAVVHAINGQMSTSAFLAWFAWMAMRHGRKLLRTYEGT
ncbi:MAG TPA: hypothetical protein ENH15_01960 [Actinobacteria bacterium]|nr:hypothetical protein [Actinomycetota bacterium]